MSLSEKSVRAAADNAVLVLSARVLQVVGVPLAVALLIFYLQNGDSQRDKINDTLGNLNAAVAVLKERTDRIYSADDASKDFELRDNQIGDLRSDLSNVGQRLDANTHRIEALEAVRNRYIRPR